MIIRNLDENGDWTFGQGVGSYATQEAAIELNIKTRINSWLNDCFFAQTAGIDWYNRLGSKGQAVLLDADLRRIILQSYGVTGLVSFFLELNPQTRLFTATYTITTIFSGSLTSTLASLPNGALETEGDSLILTEGGSSILIG